MTKKTLIELMLENDVKWPEGAEFAVQHKCNLCVVFSADEYFVRDSGKSHWTHSNFKFFGSQELPELCRNWHQTIVTREQYEAAIAARGETIISTHSASELVDEHHGGDVYAVDISDSDDEAVIVEYLDVDSIINQIAHHQAESQRHEEAMLDHNDKELALRDQLNEMLAKVGMKVVDAERKVVADNGGWPDYCDESGIVVDWGSVPVGSRVECIEITDERANYYDIGESYIVNIDSYGDNGPINKEGEISAELEWLQIPPHQITKAPHGALSFPQSLGG